ncbi:MAG: hypothetical protein K9W44_16465 [Candidatus Lokiarchaeota archaeon]|nr:hypothetical protein [Candidatus Harpocratesius repetitus]
MNFFPLLSQFRLGITKELEKEYKNFKIYNDIPLNFDFFVNIRKNERLNYLKKYNLEEFDLADQDLFIIAKRDNSTIITNDRPLFLQCYQQHLNGYYLYDFLIAMVYQGRIKKNLLYKCNKHWTKISRFPKSTLDRIKREFHAIS